jgi:hypothetical protein
VKIHLKSVLGVLFLLIVLSETQAQYTKKNRERYAARYGVKLSTGAILAREEITYIGNEKDQIIHQIKLADAMPQFNAGFWGQKRFGWLYSDLNVLYSRYGMRYDATTFTTSGAPTQRRTERFGYVDFQVMGGLISNGFRIGVGPVMHILAHHDSELVSLENYSQKLRKVSYGFSGAIGYDMGKISIDIKYDKAFRTIGDHIYYRYKKSQFFETPDGITFAVAYSFGKEF